MNGAMGKLTYVNLFAKDLDGLSGFYRDVFGFPEIPHMRNSVFRGLDAGASCIGFMAPEVYGVLELEGRESYQGVRHLLNIDVENELEVHRLTEVAVNKGASLVKAPYQTSYGWYQSVLLDPEENVFRINMVLST